MHRSLVLALALSAPILAGCLTPGGGGPALAADLRVVPAERSTCPVPGHASEEASSWEVWSVELGDAGRVAVPLPVSRPGASFDEWVDNLTSPDDVETWTADPPPGRVVVLEGAAGAKLCSSARQVATGGDRCCAEGYLDRVWTTNRTDDGLAVWSGSAPIGLDLRYDGESRYCQANETYQGRLPDAGWGSLPGGGTADICE